MKRSALLLSLVSLGLSGCGDDKMQTDESNSGMTTAGPGGINPTTPPTTDDPTTSSDPSDPSVTEPNISATAGETMSGGSTTFDPNDCGEATVQIPIVTPNVMLVLDKSGSMVAPGASMDMPEENDGYWDHDNDPATAEITRWNSLYNVVEFIVTTFDNSMNLGAVLFPSKAAKKDYSAAACPVNETPEVKVGAMQGAAILAAIPGATDTSLLGGTPAAKGVKAALAELESIVDDQPKFMILVTDGAANCSEDAADNTALFENYDTNLSAVVAEALTKEIPTYIVGIAITDTTSSAQKDGNPDNTNTFMQLNDLAVTGGVPREGDVKFYDTQNQVELQAALEEISMQILSCTIKLEPVPKYPDYVEVSVSETAYGKKQVTDCMTESGWMFTTETKDEIVLCGQACTDFQMTGNLDAQYRCPNSG